MKSDKIVSVRELLRGDSVLDLLSHAESPDEVEQIIDKMYSSGVVIRYPTSFIERLKAFEILNREPVDHALKSGSSVLLNLQRMHIFDRHNRFSSDFVFLMIAYNKDEQLETYLTEVEDEIMFSTGRVRKS